VNNVSKIKTLEIEIHTIDQCMDVYKRRLVELNAHRESLMNNLVQLRMVPIIEA